MVSFDYYRIFYYVALYKSFTRAANVLNNNQPNITRCMNNLEHELRCKLFLRSNRGVTLTPEGERLFAHVSVAYEQLLSGEDEILKNRILENGFVSIGASETALRLWLLEQLESFHSTYPRVRIRISNHSTPQAIQALDNEQIDLAVVTTPLRIKRPLTSISRYSFDEILIGGTKYSELASVTRNLTDLQDIPMISLNTGTATSELYEQYYLSHNLVFQPDMEAATTDQILPMVQHNLGIGFCPRELAIQALADHEIVEIPCSDSLPKRQISVVHNPERPLSIAASKLLDALLAD